MQANDNSDEGVALEELGAGNLVADLRAVRISGNGADGFQAEEGGAGDLLARIALSSITNNAEYGINVVQELPGRGSLLLQGVGLTGNGSGPANAENVRVTRLGGGG